MYVLSALKPSGGLGRCPKNLQGGAGPLDPRIPLAGEAGKEAMLLSWQQGNPRHSVKGQAVVFSPRERAKISTGKYAPLTPFPLQAFSVTSWNP